MSSSYATHASKLGFWSVFALVIASQIGSGVFMLPTTLAPYGLWALAGWLISGFGALMLALVFAQLCAWNPKTGGPHTYVHAAFGSIPAFFVGWTYWVISWVSTTVVILAAIGYLTPALGTASPWIVVPLQIALLLVIVFINCRGVALAGRFEFLLTILKTIPLVFVPLAALFFFQKSHFFVDTSLAEIGVGQVLWRVTLLTLWGFVGLESATAPADSVAQPAKTIPRAVVMGTLCVALVYFFNSLALMGAVPGSMLMYSNAPYADVARLIFGGWVYMVIALVASIVCIGALNAWILTSGQVALGLAQDGFLPAYFLKKNRYDAPVNALLASSVGIIPLLLMTAHKSLAEQVLLVIDFSVTAFLFVYLACVFSFFVLLFRRGQQNGSLLCKVLYGLVAMVFCCWVLSTTPLATLAVASVFTLSGVPVYLFFYRKRGTAA